MATFKDVLNRVLIRLRQPTVTVIDFDDYTILVQEFVNQAKDDVEDAWNWTTLRQSVSITCVADTFRYELNGMTPRGQLLYNNDGLPEAWNLQTNSRLIGPMPSDWMTQRLTVDGTLQKGNPQYFDFNGPDPASTSDDDPRIDVWPVPNSTDALQIDLHVPQATLTDLTTVIKVPVNAIVYGAWAYCMLERGEEQGFQSSDAFSMYRSQLAVAIDIDKRHHPDEMIAKVV